MRYVTQRHYLAKNTLGTLPPDTTALLGPEESASSTISGGCQVLLCCERNCAVLTLGLLGHVIRLDGRDLDAPGWSDVDHEGRHHAVVMVVRRQGCGGARTAGQATTTAAPASTPARLRPSPTPAAPRSLHHGDGRRQRLPSGRKTERTKRVLEKPRASTTQSQSLSPRASSSSHVTTTHRSEHYCAGIAYRLLDVGGNRTHAHWHRSHSPGTAS